MNRKFCVGDMVIIHRPEDIDERPGWNSLMDCYDSKEVEITKYRPSGFFEVENSTRWCFNDNWAELIGDEIEVDNDITFY